jgi:tetratricopeptide (TPR) repeat protein
MYKPKILKFCSFTTCGALVLWLGLAGCSAPPSEKYQQLQKKKQQEQAQAQKQTAPPLDRGQYFADNPKGSDSDFYFKSGEAYLKRGQAQEALAEFQKTVEVNPYHRQALLYLARAAAEQASDTQLLALFNHVRKVDPNNAEIFNVVAEHYLRRGQLDQAENKLLSALKRDPNSVAARLNLAAVHQRRGDYSQAIQELEKAREKQPHHPNVLAQLAQCYWQVGNRDKAKQLMDLGLRLYPKSLDVHLAIADHYRLNGDPDRALALYRKAQTLAPNVHPILLAMAGTHVMKKDFSSALTCLLTIKEEQKGRVSPAVYQLLSEVYMKKGEPAQAEAELKEGMEKHPRDLGLRLKLGQVYLTQKKFDDALEQFEKIREVKPESSDALNHLALAHRLAGQNDKAIAVYENVLRLQPENPEALNNLAYLYAQGETKLDDALRLAKQAARQTRNHPETLDTLGFVHYKRKEYDDALKSLKRAKELSQGRPAALWLYHCALVYAAQGKKAEALAELNEAQKRNPSAAEAKEIEALREKVEGATG